jgi:ubiquinone/menaquinone biosynthesis C-methylase UbiE
MSTRDPLPNRFVIQESATEVEWLRLIGPLLTEGTGGLFAERDDDLTGIHSILDLGCGPGDWALSVAAAFPDIEVTGIDVSTTVLEEAASHARVRGLKNAHFRLMDATQPLDFPDASFDLVNARTIVGFMNPTLWPQLLRESRRIVRPGGTFRVTEFSEGLTNSAAAGTMWGLYAKALSVSGRSYDPDGRHIGIINQLPTLLRQAGFQDVQMMAHPIEHSAGTARREGWFKNYSIVFQLLKPFVINTGVMTPEGFEALYQQFQGEFLSEQFTGLEIYLTVWGESPGMPTQE